jgi:Dyp-type peroxidase family
VKPLELSDIQGIVLFGYASLPHARYVHVSWPEGSQPSTWLAELQHEVHASTRGARKDEGRVNVAFTHRGLARFALTTDELASFPRELQQGMNDELRSHVLGDVDDNAPSEWEFGGPGHLPIHALLMVFAKNNHAIGELSGRLVARISTLGGVVVHQDAGELRATQKEPFGFRDGIVQPHLTGTPRPRGSSDVEVPAGEFLLGYPNAYDELPPSPRGADGFDIGQNGSYLVYRKLRQDTSGFWQCMLDRAQPAGDPNAATTLASSMVGRWPSGAPLVKYPEFDPGPGSEKEDFAFADDPDGMKCPLGAHVRRANPRDMLEPSPEKSREAVGRHRLLRRGRAYGPPANGTPRERATSDGAERGLLFIALNASFRRQFEFVQQTWLNNPKFAGLYDERDPLVATVPGEGGQLYSVPNVPARRRLAGLPRFVTVRGGGYFFVPSLKALAWLSKRST